MNLWEKIKSNFSPIKIGKFYYRKRIFNKGYVKYSIIRFNSWVYAMYFICFVSDTNIKKLKKKVSKRKC